MRVTISIGVALCPRDAKDYDSLDTFADRASYLAKRTGKNRVWVYEEQKKKLGVDDEADVLVSPEALTKGELV
jgi:predicted signal transduction protein with EAL and GGDEF domain